ncbi:MAG: EAL domain-containing protein [Gammaproteobacteria bacterium]|nr:EAL domain-containing protein [Gammaproteobacteria bacterium]
MEQKDSDNSTPLVWRNSLAGKFISLMFIVVFAMMSINAYLNYHDRQESIVDNLKAQNAIIGNFIANIASQTMLAYDYDGLNEYMKEIGDGENVVYAAIFSAEGVALASFIQQRDNIIANLVNDKKEIDIKNIITALNNNPDIIHQRFPILKDKQVLGSFVIGLSKARIEEVARSKLVSTILISAGISLLLGIGIYTIFRTFTLRPIMQLVQGARRMSIGSYETDVQVQSNDELGRLAMSFNEMMRQIKNTNEEKDSALQQIQELNLSLEQRVEERTRELEIANQKLEKLALHDSLTNLPNRFCVQDNLNRGIADAKLTGAMFTVIMMDLDRFKEINDTLGHDCGDQLLVEVGRRLQSILRPTDLIGRLGGDEFAILLPDTDEVGAGFVAHKVLVSLDPPFNLVGMAFNVGASLGIATYPKHGVTTSALLKAADVAMYQAKHNKLGYCIYNPISDINTPDRLSLMTELRDAIQNDELSLFYQPKVDLKTREIIGVEALLRWQHKERGFIPPTEFIPMAEQSGLIRQLTYWVISTALMQLEAWHRAKLNISVSINLSMYNLQDTDFPSQLAQLLDQTNVENHYIQFEITESAIMNNPGHVMGVLAILGKMNVSFAIDDFGTGYSSLSTLKRLTVQEIKIDKSFVMDMATDTDDEAIVHSIVDMAHTLGLIVTAEGVESETTVEQLVNLGCDMIQGYHISRPLPPERVTHMLRNLRQPGLPEPKLGETNLTVIKGNKE